MLFSEPSKMELVTGRIWWFDQIMGQKKLEKAFMRSSFERWRLANQIQPIPQGDSGLKISFSLKKILHILKYAHYILFRLHLFPKCILFEIFASEMGILLFLKYEDFFCDKSDISYVTKLQM